ncbi:MAG: ABC transporter permease [Lachnospiraceae bacterium]|nr:ABC transporter permease [Lachnospiraceae bacterium]
MIRYVIKNNIKLMGRSPINIFLYIVMPLILIAVLSSSFDDLMKKYEENETLKAGYRIEDSGTSKELIDALKDIAKDNDIELTEYETGEIGDIVKNEELSGFVVFDGDSYTVYETEEEKEAGKAIEFMIGTFYESATAAAMGADTEAVAVSAEEAFYIEPVDSTDYYGIVEVVYFGWCAIVCGASLFMNEKKYKIKNKYIVADISEPKLYLANFIPMVAVVIAGAVIAAVLSVVLFKVNWGNIWLSLLIVALSAAAATAFGLMLHSFSDNMVVTIIATFTIVWFMGFFGGSFETYMFSAQPMSLKLLSPIYHTNRALVELSSMGESRFVSSSLLFSLAIMAVCSVLAILAGTARRKVRS